ncbi:hypothetical protein QYE76_002635 [Lolium multiflorum]|uniref:Uncharacterized protein n=1 Tax=Lolium multiflorum TaxID=4521 RepID=A0AAD8VY35_LOLMU|nr:hypothetical protein QYE76_002635 [Lolium multiflorum]
MDEDDASPEPKEGTAANKSNPFGKKSVGTYHTFLGTPTFRAKKSVLRILNATVPAVPQYVKWSEKACTFDRSDHPAVIPKECYALVVSPRIAVVPFKSSYHVIFGRPTYHKFHARHATSTTSSRFRVLTAGSPCPETTRKLGTARKARPPLRESVIYGEELQGYRAAVDPTRCDYQKQISEQKTSFKAAIETKKHDLVEGATYQRTMQRCLKDQIGRNVHAYVDDIAVMTRKGSDLLSDLKETFDNLRRFVSRLGEKALPLYKLLKKTDKFVWDEAADEALQGLKNMLSSPPIPAPDSDLVAQQVAGTWNARNSVMAAYRDEVDEIAKCFLGYEVKYVRRDDNTARHAVQARIRRETNSAWNLP